MILFGTPVMVFDNIIPDAYREIMLTACKEISKKVESSNKDWFCDVYTTCHSLDLNQFDEFNSYIEYCEEYVDKYLNVFGIEERLTSKQSWFNAYTKKQYQDKHKHPNVLLSTVYFLDAPEGSAPLVFNNPVDPDMTFRSTKHDVFNSSHKIKAVTNRLVVFPSWAVHSVPQGDNKELRYTIASNHGRVEDGISTT